MFIYCKKPEHKELLLNAGFKLISVQEKENGHKVWMFENNLNCTVPKVQERNAFFTSRRMTF